MKKLIRFILIIATTFLLISCTFNESQYIKPKAKPTPNYYTEKIKEQISKNKEYTIKVFDLNIYKYYEVNQDENTILPEFIDNLNIDNFNIEINENLKAEYRLIIEFPDEKYIINAYNENLISIQPWDGSYPEDTISMENIPDYYNLYKYCEYIKKISHRFEG